MPGFKKNVDYNEPTPTAKCRRRPSKIEGAVHARSELKSVPAPPINPPVGKVGGSERLHDDLLKRGQKPKL